MAMNVAMIGAPFALGQSRDGVVRAPQALREAGLTRIISDELGLTLLDQGDLVLPTRADTPDEVSDGIRNALAVAKACSVIARDVESLAREGAFCLTLGGDHSIGMGTIAGVLAARPDVGVIWVDAHGDFNTPETSPSGNFHGMPLGVLAGADSPAIRKYDFPVARIDPTRVALIGARDLDKGERNLLLAKGVHVYTMTDIDREGIGTVMAQCLAALRAAGADSLHVSFDIDAVDPAEAPGTGTRVRGGLTYREAHYVVEALAVSGRLGSMDMVELNPELDTDNKTTELCAELIASALGRRIL